MRFVITFPTFFVRDAKSMKEALDIALDGLLHDEPIVIKDEMGTRWRAEAAWAESRQEDVTDERFLELCTLEAPGTRPFTIVYCGSGHPSAEEKAFAGLYVRRFEIIDLRAEWLDVSFDEPTGAPRVYVRAAHPLLNELQHAYPPPFKAAGLTFEACEAFFDGNLVFVFPDGTERRYIKDEGATS